MKPTRITKFSEGWVQEDAYDALEAIVKELAEMEAHELTNGDDNEFPIACMFCQTVTPNKSEQHESSCLWLRAKALMSE